MDDFKVLIGAELNQTDLDKIKAQLQSNISSTPVKIKVQSDSNDIKNDISILKKQIDRLGDLTIRINGGRDITNVIEQFKELKNIQNQLSQKVTKLATLDTTKDQNQIKQLKSQIEQLKNEYRELYNLKDKDGKKLSENLSTSQINELSREYDNLLSKLRVLDSAMTDTNNETKKKQAIKSVNDAYQQLMQIQSRMSQIELKIKGLDDGTNVKEVKALRDELTDLQTVYNELFKYTNGNLNNSQLTKFASSIEEAKAKMAQLDAKIADTKAKLASDINIKVNDGSIDATMAKLDTSMNKLSTKSETLEKDFTELKKIVNSLGTTSGTEELISKYQKYEEILKKVTNEITVQTQAEKQANDTAKLMQAKQKLSYDMDIWLKNNSKAANEFGARVRQLQAELESCDSVRFNGIKSQFQNMQKEAVLFGKTGLTLIDRFKEKFASLTAYFSVATIYIQAYRALTGIYNNVVKIDTAMTELYRVTDLTDSQYSKMYKDMTQSAKEYGIALDDIINSTASWVRLGFDTQDSTQLAEITAMYQHVTDLDESTAVENLVTAYKGFQDQLKNLYNGKDTDAIEHVADVFDILGK